MSICFLKKNLIFHRSPDIKSGDHRFGLSGRNVTDKMLSM
jgi:hypothetical protein